MSVTHVGHLVGHHQHHGRLGLLVVVRHLPARLGHPVHLDSLGPVMVAPVGMAAQEALVGTLATRPSQHYFDLIEVQRNKIT